MFHVRLKQLRTKHELTQKELAKKLNLQNTAISKYELNERNPDLDILNNIADFFDVSIDYLLGRTSSQESIVISKEIKADQTPADKLSEDIHNLSLENQKEIKEIIELYKIKDKQVRNSEFVDELSFID